MTYIFSMRSHGKYVVQKEWTIARQICNTGGMRGT